MTELVKVVEENGYQLVSARELHEFLESKQDFSDWIKARIEKYGFIEDEDFTIILGKSNGGRPSKEYILKLDVAKELSMVEGNDKGRQARKYFIECEKRLKELSLDSYMIEDKVERAKKWIEEQEEKKLIEEKAKQLQLEVKEKEEVIEVQKPKVEYYEKVLDSSASFTVTQIAKAFEMTAVSLNKVLQNQGIQFYQSGMWHLYSKYQGKGYTDIRTHMLPNGDTRKSLTWTEKGMEFIGQVLESL